MENKKQSSIEWLVSILNKSEFALVLTDEEIQQAKAMHKDEIVETARYYFHQRGKLTPKQLYNETFGGNNE